MKKLYIILRVVVAVLSFSAIAVGCESLDETPEINKGYKTNIRIPDGEPLTDEDRDYIDEMEMEYENATK